MTKVYILDNDITTEQMFKERDEGYTIVQHLDEAELIVFTGGEDITPEMYGHKRLAKTGEPNTVRDEDEFKVWESYLYLPKVGICRGGQFLNVCNGGTMIQHTDGHALNGTHQCLVLGDKYDVTSTHHQMMVPAPTAEVIGYAPRPLSTYRVYWDTDQNKEVILPKIKYDLPDIEILYYHDTSSLCFQPHPEYTTKGHECQELFFTLLETYLLQ